MGFLFLFRFVLFSVLFIELLTKVIWRFWFFLSWGHWFDFLLLFFIVFLLLFTLCGCWLFLLLNFVALGCYVHDEGSVRLKLLHIWFLIIAESLAKLFVDDWIITLLSFALLDCLGKPSAEFEVFRVSGSVEPEFKLLLAFPEFGWLHSLNLSHFWSEMLLVIIIVVRNVFLVVGSVSVLIQNELTETVVFKDKLSMWA